MTFLENHPLPMQPSNVVMSPEEEMMAAIIQGFVNQTAPRPQTQNPNHQRPVSNSWLHAHFGNSIEDPNELDDLSDDGFSDDGEQIDYEDNSLGVSQPQTNPEDELARVWNQAISQVQERLAAIVPQSQVQCV